MSELEDDAVRAAAWLETLDEGTGPCGPDLEYDNEFLVLVQAAAGKPESQFEPAQPPDWPEALAAAAKLMDRSRDLRIAIFWVRALVHLRGWSALSPGLALLQGLVEGLWDSVHPLPDPDDGDPYARVNALTLLRENEGLLGDLRGSAVVRERSIGEITGRSVELAFTLSAPVGEESVPDRVVLSRMVQAAVAQQPALAGALRDADARIRTLQAALSERLSDAPDLRPLQRFVAAAVQLLPSAAEAADGEVAADGEGGAAVAGGGTGARLSGAVNSREDALRAIDLVCDFLERTEPSNPAPLFLRRGRYLINHNFLQLMKALAPEALAGVAHAVGVDPDSVQPPDAA